MARPKKETEARLEILADGVFVADDRRKDKGDIAEGVDPETAAALVKNGHARLL